jgi:hypothetical protein
MKQRLWWVALNVLAVIIVLARIRWALYGLEGFWTGIIKLYTPFGAEQIGADFESLVEDWIVFVVIRHDFWRYPKSTGLVEKKAPESSHPEING